MSLTRSLAWNTGVQIAGKSVSTALGVVIVGVMTRYLGQAGFGAYSTANAFLQIFALLLDLGLNVTLVAILGEHAGEEAYERRAVSAIYTLRFVMGVVVFALALPIAWLFPYSATLKLAIGALIGSFFFASLNQIVIGVHQRHLKMHAVAVAENIGRAVLLGGLLIARHLGWGLVPVVWLVSLAGFANFFVNYLVARRYASFAWNWDWDFWKTALKRSWPIGVTIAFNIIYYKADTVILSLVRSQAEVGIYSAAYRVLDILITVPFMYAGVLLPVLSRAWAGRDRRRFSHLLGRSVDVMMLLIAPLVVGVIVLGRPIMTLVAGKDFAASGDVLRVLILATGIIYLHTVYSHAVIALDAQRKMIPIYVAVALVTLGAYFLFIPAFGMWAAAWLTVASETAVGAGSWWITHRQAPTRYHPKTTVAAALAAVLMGVCVYLLRHLWLPLPILAGAAVYPLLVLLFGGVSKDTVKEILSLRRDAPEVI